MSPFGNKFSCTRALPPTSAMGVAVAALPFGSVSVGQLLPVVEFSDIFGRMPPPCSAELGNILPAGGVAATAGTSWLMAGRQSPFAVENASNPTTNNAVRPADSNERISSPIQWLRFETLPDELARAVQLDASNTRGRVFGD